LHRYENRILTAFYRVEEEAEYEEEVPADEE
jgi:hypothetical protein